MKKDVTMIVVSYEGAPFREGWLIRRKTDGLLDVFDKILAENWTNDKKSTITNWESVWLISYEKVSLGEMYYSVVHNKIMILQQGKEAMWKVVATPDKIGLIKSRNLIISMTRPIKSYHIDAILTKNMGKCKIEADYKGVVTTEPSELVNEIVNGLIEPKLENGKVIIYSPLKLNT